MVKKITIYSEIREYLIKNANAIQKRATERHKELLGGDKFRSEIIKKYQDNHIKVVEQLAKHLQNTDIKRGSGIFMELGVTLAEDSVRDRLTIEEATDGIIFLKQSIWHALKKEGFLKKLTTEEFYAVSQTTGTYADIVVSKIAFTYHRHYSEEKAKQEMQKNEFIAMASHELKTPVTSVKAYTQVLQNKFAKAGDVDSAMLLMKMDSQLNKLTGLISDLLDVAKIETGKLQINKGFFDFNELVTEVVEETQRTTTKHTIELSTDQTKILNGDRDRIGQVILNLLTNSIKYSPKAKKIIVRTEANNDSVQLSVQDFGIGIPKEAQKKVFQQYYRATGKDEETFSGMGLGLFVTAEIIRRHEGKIWIESEKGVGTTISFTLPVGKK